LKTILHNADIFLSLYIIFLYEEHQQDEHKWSLDNNLSMNNNDIIINTEILSNNYPRFQEDVENVRKILVDMYDNSQIKNDLIAKGDITISIFKYTEENVNIIKHDERLKDIIGKVYTPIF
jgi:hypothetical protein